MRGFCLAAAISAMFSSAGNAVGPYEVAAQPAAAAATAQCELHVFTQEKFNVLGPPSTGVAGPVAESVVSGIFSVRHPELVEQFMRENLGGKTQTQLLGTTLPASIPAFKRFRFITEPPVIIPYKKLDDIKNHKKIFSSTNPCYAEINIMSITYLRNTLSRTLRLLITYREFGSSDEAKVFIIKAPASAVDAFPPKSDDGKEMARKELQATFAAMALKAFKGKEGLVGSTFPEF